MCQLQFCISEDKKVEHSKYLLQVLLPFLKRVNDEQMIEMEIEARRQGIFCFCQTGVGTYYMEFVDDTNKSAVQELQKQGLNLLETLLEPREQTHTEVRCI